MIASADYARLKLASLVWAQLDSAGTDSAGLDQCGLGSVELCCYRLIGVGHGWARLGGQDLLGLVERIWLGSARMNSAGLGTAGIGLAGLG